MKHYEILFHLPSGPFFSLLFPHPKADGRDVNSTLPDRLYPLGY